MATTRSRKVFINLSVKNLQRSIDFFTKLGFTFDKRFTDDSATCMILSEEGFVMLIAEDRFRDFTKKQLCDTRTHSEALFALALESRAEVDELMKAASAAGGTKAMEPSDLGFMYTQSFYDLDGHHWELFHMDPKGPPQQ